VAVVSDGLSKMFVQSRQSSPVSINSQSMPTLSWG
jgi:hypothetical protein